MNDAARVLACICALGGAPLAALGLGGCTESAHASGAQLPDPTEGLDDDEADAFREAAAEVRKLEAERAAPAKLEPLLADEREGIRQLATWALARLEHTEAVDALTARAQDASAGVREAAVFGLGQMDVALVIGDEEHDRLRGAIERSLIFELESERAPEVRLAAIRAIGRISTGAGLEFLKQLADDESPEKVSERAAALMALGVSGRRRGPTMKTDAELTDIVAKGLADDEVAVTRGAAYALFRQHLKVPRSSEKLFDIERDAQTVIHLLRAVAQGAGPAALAERPLQHPDWRVRVEGVRVLRAQNPVATEPILAVLEQAAAELAQTPASGAVHLVREGCLSLINSPASVTQAALRKLAGELAGVRADAACACAVAHDAQQAKLELVKTCAPDWSEERRRRLGVQVASSSLISSRERAAWLLTALDDESPRVRLEAAAALGREQTEAAAKAAAVALPDEPDAAVAAALLGAIVEPHTSQIGDHVLITSVERFYDAKTIETAEPLREAARLLRGRKGSHIQKARGRLGAHPLHHVRLAASGLPYGNRDHEPFARTTHPAPDPLELPVAAELFTERGKIRIEFERSAAPGTVANFVELAEAGVLAGTRFHRVVPNFVSQGGDPRDDGSGGPGYTIPCEHHDGPYTRGAVGMALAGKDTGGSQFFLTHSEQPHLDGRYTLFARVVEGTDVMDALGPDDRLISVEILSDD